MQTSVKLASLQGDRIRITFPFDRKTTSQVKGLFGSRFRDKDGQKYWTAPATNYTAEQLSEWGFTLSGRLRQKIGLPVDPEPIEVPGIKQPLFPYQARGVAFIELRNGCALVADEQGLGKTITSLAYLQLHPEFRPAVIVTPASVKLNWRNEALNWIEDDNIEILYGQKPFQTTGSILIVNYDILHYWLAELMRREPSVIIADEAHLIKSKPKKKRDPHTGKLTKEIKSGHRTAALQTLVRSQGKHRRFIALTGTPVVNRPIEYFNVLNLLAPKVFTSRWSFAERFCGLKHDGFGWNYSGDSHSVELHRTLTVGGPMIRRLKSEVLPDLPPKIRSFVPMEVSKKEMDDYRKARDQFKLWVQQTRGAGAAQRATNAEAITKIGVLKQLAARAKLNAACNWIRDQLSTGNKLVVFAIHREIVDRLMTGFGSVAVKIDGSVHPDLRSDVVRKFQTDPGTTLFVGNIKAAGVGITLTAASSEAFLELPWSPADLDQAEDRCHRIGQDYPVNIHYLLAEGTIDSKIAHLLDAKRKVVRRVTDGKETEDVDLLETLLGSLDD